MNFRLGCAIWAYKGWVGELFPPESRSGEFLRLYGQRFTTVEGNTTFYSIPDAQMLSRWVAETPDGFQFCLKLPRTFTHQGMLVPQIPAMQRFVGQMGDLGNRLGPLFAQLPPSYSPSYLSDLEIFLQALPREQAEFALEVRHPAWFREPHFQQLTDLLQGLGIGRVLLDTRPLYDVPDELRLPSEERRKPRLPLHLSLTSDFGLIRYISHPNLEINQPFMQEWTVQIGAWLRQQKRIYLFVHCPVEARSPRNARYFQHLLESQQVPIPPLPWDEIIQQSPTQLYLF